MEAAQMDQNNYNPTTTTTTTTAAAATNHTNNGGSTWLGLPCVGCHRKEIHRRWAYCSECLLQVLGCKDLFSPRETTNDLHNHKSAVQPSIEEISQAQQEFREVTQKALVSKSRSILANEWQLASRVSAIDGLPIHLAQHLLEIHWSVHHNLFQLTSRAGIIGELLEPPKNNFNHDGSSPDINTLHSSPFLLNAIFACASQCSDRREFRNPIVAPFDSPAMAHVPGRYFFLRCEQLCREEKLLDFPRLSTVSGLLLLASAYTNIGSSLRGRVYVDLAARMALELGLHVDEKLTAENGEELEARRRVFWAASICERMQLLYSGEPVLPMGVVETEVLLDFLDTTEEEETVRPADLRVVPFRNGDEADAAIIPEAMAVGPLQSASALKHMTILLGIMSEILNELYCANPTAMEAHFILMLSVETLRGSLPPELIYEPQREDPPAGVTNATASTNPPIITEDQAASSTEPRRMPAPQVIVLNVLYHSITILLFRPFVANPVLGAAAPPDHSWSICFIAARYITETVRAYARVYSLRGSEYFLGFSIYAACTIHARNASRLRGKPMEADARALLEESVAQLTALAKNAPGFHKPLQIIIDLISACEEIEREALANHRNYNLFIEPIAETFPDLWDDKSKGQKKLPNDSLIGFM